MLCFDDDALPTAMTHTYPCMLYLRYREAGDAEEAELRSPGASSGDAAYIPKEKYERDSKCRNARRGVNSANLTQCRFCQNERRATSAILVKPCAITLVS